MKQYGCFMPKKEYIQHEIRSVRMACRSCFIPKKEYIQHGKNNQNK